MNEDEVENPEQWDVRTAIIPSDRLVNWGVQERLMPAALQLLRLNKPSALKVESTKRQYLTLAHFRDLVEILYAYSPDIADVNEALQFHIEKNVKKNDGMIALIRSIQHTLRSFFSPYTDPRLAELTADGVWGKLTAAAFNKVCDSFNLKKTGPDEAMDHILKQVSEKLIECTVGTLYLTENSIPNNYLILTPKESAPLTLVPSGNGASIHVKASDRELVHFSSYLRRDQRGRQHFDRFSFWFMLLNLKKTSVGAEHSLMARDGVNLEWEPLDGTETVSQKDFLIPANLELVFDDLNPRIDIRLPQALAESEIYGLFFSGDLNYQLVTALSVETSGSLSADVFRFHAKDFFHSYSYMNDQDSEVLLRCKADYLKIFVLEKGWQNRLSETGPAVKNADSSLLSLITADQTKVKAIYNIALSFKRKGAEIALPFNNKWILIAGSGDASINTNEKLVSIALGRLLAINGYGLIHGGWPGVDEVTASAYAEYANEYEIDLNERLIQILEDKQQSGYTLGKQIRLSAKANWYEAAVSSAMALIVIGGKGGAFNTYKEAKRKKIPVIPLPSTGGDARKIYLELDKEGQAVINTERLGSPDKIFDQEQEASDLAAKVLVILEDMKRVRVIVPMNKTQFKAVVERIYKQRKVLVNDDLQKKRWGGTSTGKGKQLSAEVAASKVPGFYNVTLMIRSTSSVALTGRVAFFVHDSFSEEIRYVTVEDGEAKTSLRAYEAFTAAAYTEDGTELELDLNETESYPDGFYYSDIAEEFKKDVKELYKRRPVTISDDLQKNRWGGLPENNGKLLSATVSSGLLPRYYNVVVEVNASSGSRLVGDVAFFVHDSFHKEVMYRKVKNGKARISLTAYEAFTVAAFTQDGTMLELDLQQEKGYPEKFYYKS